MACFTDEHGIVVGGALNRAEFLLASRGYRVEPLKSGLSGVISEGFSRDFPFVLIEVRAGGDEAFCPGRVVSSALLFTLFF